MGDRTTGRYMIEREAALARIIHVGRTEIAEGVAGTAQLALTRYNTSLIIHHVDPRSKFRQRRQLLGPAYESMNHPR